MSYPELAEKLRQSIETIKSSPVVTGFDGFVDEMISVVDQRQSLDTYQRIETIDTFGDKIKAAAGHSSLREIVVTQVDPGGCAVNMGDGLATLGIPVTTFATLGEPIHSAFADYAQKAKLVSWGKEPGKTLAYEFADGKLMFSAVTQLQDFKPENLAAYLADGAFFEACSAAKLIAITDWTLYPHMTACWNMLIDEVFSKLPERPSFFFDLVDPSSRSDEDILEMQTALKRFADIGHVALGLNQNEANILCRLNELDVEPAKDVDAAVVQGRALVEQLGIDEVIIHSIKYAVGVDKAGEASSAYGPYCEKPLKSTGAGDRFNSGYTLGYILGLGMEERLLVACGSSGYFVRNAKSASTLELAQFLIEWGG